MDWLQIQDYISWKTDRLNESILTREEFLKFNPDQTNMDNFNFEAYMAGQYVGKEKKGIKDEYLRGNFRKLKLEDGIFLLGYRLPTEAEWEYASSHEFQNNNMGKENYYPYGKKYFILDYAYNINLGLTGQYETSDLNRIKGATTYNNSFYGIYNMGNNIKEWLHDEYISKKKNYAGTNEIYTGNGFLIGHDSLIKDKNIVISIRDIPQRTQYKDKDEEGRMMFRIMDVKNNGQPLNIIRYQYKQEYIEYLPNPDSLVVRDFQMQRIKATSNRDFYTYELMRKYRSSYNFSTSAWQKKGFYKYVKVKLNDTLFIDSAVLDTNAVMNEPELIKERSLLQVRKKKPLFGEDTITRNRVVKSGTWRNPSTTARESMKETNASADVGFRTILPYTAIPTMYKVKWK